MGRPAKPIQLHQANGNIRHLTKAEIAQREKQEASLKSGQTAFRASAEVKADKVAKAMFNRLKKLYAQIEYVEALDENVINRYCLLHSECLGLQRVRRDLQDQLDRMGESESEASDAKLSDDKSIPRALRFLSPEEEARLKRPASPEMQLSPRLLWRAALADRILELDQKLQKKMDMLLKLEDRLFLNPTARLKNAPRKAEEPKQQTPFERMYGRV